MPAIKMFRTPDEQGKGWAIWYGPGGRQANEATVVALLSRGLSGEEYLVGEVQNVEGLIETPPKQFLVTYRAITLPREYINRSLSTKLRIAASAGVEELAERGGDEEWADTLQAGIGRVT